MTNPDTVEAVALLAQNLMSRHLQISEDGIEGTGPASYAIARAIAAMPGSDEAMRETALRADFERKTGRPRGLSEAEVFLATAIRALPLPQGGGSAAPAGWKLVPIEPTPEMMEVAWSHAPLDMEDMSDGHYGQAYKDMLAAAPLPPAVEPYAWLCTSPELDPVIVYGRENAESYAAQPERWTVEALCRGATLGAPLPSAQEG